MDPLSVSPDAANSYIVVLGDKYIRFIQNEEYVLEDPVTITALTQAGPCEVTAPGHGFSNGDYVFIDGVVGTSRLNGQYFWVKNVTTDTFTLHNAVGTDVDTTDYADYVSGGRVSRVYTVVSPYAAEDLSKLSFNQIRNELRITSNFYVPRTLTRVSHTSWTLTAALTIDLPARPSRLDCSGK